MNNSLFGSTSDPKTKADEQSDDEMLNDFDPNEESQSEGGEYMDDSLRMVDQPFEGNI